MSFRISLAASIRFHASASLSSILSTALSLPLLTKQIKQSCFYKNSLNKHSCLKLFFYHMLQSRLLLVPVYDYANWYCLLRLWARMLDDICAYNYYYLLSNILTLDYLEATHIVVNKSGQINTDSIFQYFTISPNLNKIIIVFGSFVIIMWTRWFFLGNI